MEVVQTILRLIQLLWIIILLGLLGNVIASNRNGHMASINYALFSVVLATVTVLWGLGTSLFSALAGGPMAIITLALDGLSTLFTFIAGIVLAAKLHAVDCGGNLSHRSSNWIGFGSGNDEKRCRELQASTAFLWFLFACLAATFAMSIMQSMRGGSTGSGVSRRFGGSSAGASGGGPHMAQVRV
ncbi:MARVEL-like domain protein [Niveomyces insectorum RCEF 264]|uniref:MARVEL-like domain protein n=1 Tax=Niveomyces insectorum RCEF 264 TaxID=1081102 RepID=A0A168A389_9HYPO|nr:MARVEL-like domain protein [Niveomyces insectorum RCEF 264]